MFFFFFKQKTAYEMRISDWSSDVCSSDLCVGLRESGALRRRPSRAGDLPVRWLAEAPAGTADVRMVRPRAGIPHHAGCSLLLGMQRCPVLRAGRPDRKSVG